MSGIFIRNTLTSGIALASVQVPLAIEDEVLDVAIEALEYAKANAPWEDRTGYAREGLDTNVEMQDQVIVWDLFHTMDYGLYLETRWNGRYAIIMPTLEIFAPRVGRGLEERVGDYG